MSGQHTHQHWLQRWHDNAIGWHHEEFNPLLLQFWPRLQAPDSGQVLVPLCGKSWDMIWLAEQGYSVLGVELSPLAVAAFFAERGLKPQRQPLGEFESWQAGPYQILCGDLFHLQADLLEQVCAVYDRASLVALTPEQRIHYAQLLGDILPPDCPMLFIAMDYPQAEMAGPPYSVPRHEIEQLFTPEFHWQLQHTEDLLANTDRYSQWSLSRMLEQVYLLRRR